MNHLNKRDFVDTQVKNMNSTISVCLWCISVHLVIVVLITYQTTVLVNLFKYATRFFKIKVEQSKRLK